jgi:hypothetical protein
MGLTRSDLSKKSIKSIFFCRINIR